DMRLDDDLGIDSIKRVEILSALQERLPELAAPPPDRLGSFRTLRAIAEFLGASGGSVPVPAKPERMGERPSRAPEGGRQDVAGGVSPREASRPTTPPSIHPSAATPPGVPGGVAAEGVVGSDGSGSHRAVRGLTFPATSCRPSGAPQTGSEP